MQEEGIALAKRDHFFRRKVHFSAQHAEGRGLQVSIPLLAKEFLSESGVGAIAGHDETATDGRPVVKVGGDEVTVILG